MTPSPACSPETFPVDLPACLSSGAPVALLEDNLGDAGARCMDGLVAYLCAWRGEAVPGVLARIEAATQAGHWVVLGAAYELGYALEPALLARQPATTRPLLEAWIWQRCTRLDAAATDALVSAAVAALPAAAQTAGLSPLLPAQDAAAYAQRVEAVQALIAAGDCYQVNLTFPLHAYSYGDPLALYARLRAHQPVGHGVFLRHARGVTLSRSPELFIARSGTRLTTRPMKGTAPRGARAQLAASVKDRAENLMIVDLLRNDLGRLAPAGGVRVTQLFAVEDYATLHQMTSTIEAAPVTADLATTLRALFPCGSITGAPKIRAMEIIRELEPAPRGLYCGALGWLAPDGDLSLNVAIRTLEITPGGRVELGIGSGIVADSQAADEYAECLAKARFASELAPPLRLIETLRHEPGTGIPLLDRHLARLTRSARELGFVCDAARVRTALAESAARCPKEGPARIRLTLGPDGSLDIAQAPLDALPAGPTVTLAAHPLPDAALLAHKTTARAHYEAELARVSAQGHFDALFFNARGQLCEGARSNVFLRLDGGLYTPPLACGLLPGVMREALLADGVARERVLERGDLARAEAVYVANALRGLIAVRLVTDT